jgi:hypothetical protein
MTIVGVNYHSADERPFTLKHATPALLEAGAWSRQPCSAGSRRRVRARCRVPLLEFVLFPRAKHSPAPDRQAELGLDQRR